MIRISKQFVIILLGIYFLHCAGSGNYIKDRGNDLGDIVSVSLDAGLGVSGSIGPVSSGLGFHGNILGCKYSYCGSYNDASGTILLGWQNKYLIHKEEFGLYEDEYFVFRGKRYLANDPQKRVFPVSSYGRVRIRIAILLGFTIEFNFLELTDFLLGIGGVDILEDDWNTYYETLSRSGKKLSDQNGKQIESPTKP